MTYHKALVDPTANTGTCIYCSEHHEVQNMGPVAIALCPTSHRRAHNTRTRDRSNRWLRLPL